MFELPSTDLSGIGPKSGNADHGDRIDFEFSQPGELHTGLTIVLRDNWVQCSNGSRRLDYDPLLQEQITDGQPHDHE